MCVEIAFSDIVLTRYSPARRPKRTWHLLTASRATRFALALSATISDLYCACVSTVDVEVEPRSFIKELSALTKWLSGLSC